MNATPDSRRDRFRAQLFFVVTLPACAPSVCHPLPARLLHKALPGRLAAAPGLLSLRADCWLQGLSDHRSKRTPHLHVCLHHVVQRPPRLLDAHQRRSLRRAAVSVAYEMALAVAAAHHICKHNAAGSRSPWLPSRSLQSGRRCLRSQADSQAWRAERTREHGRHFVDNLEEPDSGECH